MADWERVETLHLGLISHLEYRMVRAGWHADPTADLRMGDGVVGLFRRPLTEDFSATALFRWRGDLPPLEVETVIGVSCQRSFRVWPFFLNGYSHSELRVGIDDLDPAAGLVSLWEVDEMDRAAERLVGPVLERAMGWAERFASFDELLAALRTLDDADAEVYDIPVVLASAGRSDEALDALVTALATPSDADSGSLRDEFAGRFRAWLAAGAPPTPPSS